MITLKTHVYVMDRSTMHDYPITMSNFHGIPAGEAFPARACKADDGSSNKLFIARFVQEHYIGLRSLYFSGKLCDISIMR